MKCDICNNKIISTELEGWYHCVYCYTEYPLKWMQARFEKTKDKIQAEKGNSKN